MTLMNKIVKGVLVTFLVVAIILVVYLVVIHNPGDDYTEFYMLDEYNNTTDIPINMSQNSAEKIFIGITNKEHQDMNYTVKIKKDDVQISQFKKTLKDKDTVEVPYIVDNTEKRGINQTLEFELYKGNVSNPYRSLLLRYNVV